MPPGDAKKTRKGTSTNCGQASKRLSKATMHEDSLDERMSQKDGKLGAFVEELRKRVLLEGLDDWIHVDGMVLSRCEVWKLLLGVEQVSAKTYVRWVKMGPSALSNKIKNDTFRTFANDSLFKECVPEKLLIRVLNAYVNGYSTKDPSNGGATGYVQGMNALCAPFLFIMPELDAFWSFSQMVNVFCPRYVLPQLDGVHDGVALVEECLEAFDSDLHSHLQHFNLDARIYAFPAVLTLSACTPPLEEVLLLWDFLVAYGVGLNILCVVAQVLLVRDKLLDSSSPMALLRKFPPLEARPVISLVCRLMQGLPDELIERMQLHPTRPVQRRSLLNSGTKASS